MSADANSFLRMKARESPTGTLNQQLIAVQYLRQLEERLHKIGHADEDLRSLKKSVANLLREFRNVLLRFDDAPSWRRFAQATRARKGESEAGKCFARLLGKNLLPADAAARAAHPVGQAMQQTRAAILNELQERADRLGDFESAEIAELRKFLDTFGEMVFVAAVRDWLCLAISRVLNEREEVSHEQSRR